MTHSWHLLHLHPQNQSKFCDHIHSTTEIPLYFPRYDRITRPHGHRTPISTPTPVYPGYVFSKIATSESINTLLRTPVKVSFVRYKISRDFMTIPDSVITELKRLESLNMLMTEKIYNNPYYPGRKIRVTHPVADIQGIIIRLIGATRVKVDTRLGEMITQIHSIAFLD